MCKVKFIIRIDIFIHSFKLGELGLFSKKSIKVSSAIFQKQRTISNSEKQRYISQMSVIDVYVKLKHVRH